MMFGFVSKWDSLPLNIGVRDGGVGCSPPPPEFFKCQVLGKNK